MLASQRHTMILELLEKEGTVHTADLVKRMEVSSETIRKDLDYLEQSGQLVGYTAEQFRHPPAAFRRSRGIYFFSNT